ncbi:hypothetical protein ATCR1_06891 [Agrobacterium tumefaciens CCNWGS0286]|uniref:hypothetical protein n=1 Tax=Agrobacterium tumefaciens TaxID=358 RepID=UPI0002334B2A|nr:hypothetical protein [Agrobacterium tumefaciens]EHH07573.1 hypothetical protein ATCR1_06891 [Agrobacterium tumefaciens CCNWGS0286]
MARVAKPDEPLTVERIERALDKLAETIVFLGDDGQKLLILYEHVEKELERMQQLESKMDAIRARAALSKQRRQHKDSSR